MSADESEYWYVRDAGVVSGPFPADELRARRDCGDLTWSQEISQDGDVWVSATTLGAGVGGTNTRARRDRGRGVAGIVGLALAGVGLLALIWAWGGDSGGPELAENDPKQPVSIGDPADPDPHSPAPDPVPGPTTGSDPGPGPTTKAPTSPSGPADPQPTRSSSRLITSARSQEQISPAVGFVVCGRSYRSDDGTVTELPFVTGTCFAVSEDGYLLTNRHVVEDIPRYRDSDERREAERKKQMTIEPRIWIFFLPRPGNTPKKVPASIVFMTDPRDDIDLAVLKIEGDVLPLPYYFRLAARRSSDSLKARDVYSLGFPAAARLPILGERKPRESIELGTKIEDIFRPSDLDFVQDRGIVNVVRRESGNRGTTVEWVFHGAKTSPGNSGGPLITEDGVVVGINTLVQRIEKDAVTNYVALGVSTILDVLVARVPEVGKAVSERAENPPPTP